jgi:hypothetical protein
LVNAALAEDKRLALSVSFTTRPPRAGEVNGREYHFVDRKTFDSMLERGEFLESAQVHGNRYGTSQKWIADARAKGLDILLEIDWGAPSGGASETRGYHLPRPRSCRASAGCGGGPDPKKPSSGDCATREISTSRVDMLL